MDRWKYYGITHRDHVIMNPLSSDKLEEFVSLLDLDPGADVLDIACGKAELLIRIANRYEGVSGVGVDLSPFEVPAATRRVKESGLADRIEILEMDGADYEIEPRSLDLVTCIGATWIWDGYLGTIEALKKMVKPGGLIAVGEPYKMKEPSTEYENADPGLAANLVTHAENVGIAVNAGLTPLYTIVSNQDDWDRYEGLQWRAAEAYAIEHPDDEDVEDLLERTRTYRAVYLRHARDTLNWAIYLYRAPR